jgi:hypothetical protein
MIFYTGGSGQKTSLHKKMVPCFRDLLSHALVLNTIYIASDILSYPDNQ